MEAGLTMRYEILIRGHIGDAWFQEMTLTRRPDYVTLLRGQLADQAALYSILRRIHDLGMELLSVSRVEEAQGP